MRTKRVFQVRKARNFSEKLEGTFDFIRVTAKPLFKSLFFFTSPFVLVGTFLFSNLFSSLMAITQSADSGVEPDLSSIMSIGVSAFGFLFLMIFAGTMVVSVIYANIRLYELNQNADYTINEVWEKTKKMYWPIFGATFLYGVFFFVAYFVIMIPASLILVFLSILLIPVVYLVFAFFLVLMFTALPAQIFGRKSLGNAISHSFKLLKGNWWSSLGLLILLMLIYNVVSVVFSIPFYVGMVFSVVSALEVDLMQETPMYMVLLNYLAGAILLVGTFITYSVPIVGMTLQYFNLSEIKEATSLIERIDSFGEAEPEEEEHY
ncbi:MAG: hypothetical protein COW03_13215 [Cytophagales bacterium CG12_big_fil_rev_8_21_14_0_65_40_12]|nr:MAG: hypothetical protein COW03_13215 [Cytophagales bacterium CG12_big_fil_rev_8_21_14_0_65_40_12]PIW03098.1 MAG: hypothetical protein COW40_17290 [Cytophagales bacterium CG17_big_fil_post_rev_8_21_14_2_50_40_13]